MDHNTPLTGTMTGQEHLARFWDLLERADVMLNSILELEAPLRHVDFYGPVNALGTLALVHLEAGSLISNGFAPGGHS